MMKHPKAMLNGPFFITHDVLHRTARTAPFAAHLLTQSLVCSSRSRKARRSFSCTSFGDAGEVCSCIASSEVYIWAFASSRSSLSVSKGNPALIIPPRPLFPLRHPLVSFLCFDFFFASVFTANHTRTDHPPSPPQSLVPRDYVSFRRGEGGSFAPAGSILRHRVLPVCGARNRIDHKVQHFLFTKNGPSSAPLVTHFDSSIRKFRSVTRGRGLCSSSLYVL